MEKYISLIGIPIQIGICYALSTDRKRIDWKLVAWGLILQFVFCIVYSQTLRDRHFLHG
jgi:CNT family concentrative nucleoside transporter